jgi:signal transduction histidine kinase
VIALAVLAQDHPANASADRSSGGRTASLWRFDLENFIRAFPIRWRILSIAILNSAVVAILAGLIWNGGSALNRAWEELRHVRESDLLLVLLEGEAGRLQNLIHRYINEPSPEIFAEILLEREAVLGTLRTRHLADPLLAPAMLELAKVTERFLDGFNKLRAVQATITKVYETQVLRPAREMAGLYSILEGSITQREQLIRPSLDKSREAFTTAVVAANAYYLSLASGSAEEARRSIETIEKTIPVMTDLADDEIQRPALLALGERAALLRRGLANLAEQFSTRTHVLRTAIDGNQATMISTIDGLQRQMRAREKQAQASFDHTLTAIFRSVLLVAVIFMTAILIGGMIVARSIRLPLQDLREAMLAIVSGQYGRPIDNTAARDEIGDMARAVEVFRDNAIAKQRAEMELRASKEHAENALAELRNTQKSLIDAEKLAALGGLVAGVAHEVNNPVGISLTVASSLARRCDLFASEVTTGPLRRSRLDDFIAGVNNAARQLVANLQRAGELIQSFKQVAVDRSHAERREFELREATEQIIDSVRPVLRKAHITIKSDVSAGLVMDSDPGSYGQVLTNILLNSVIHGFPDGRTGKIEVRTRALGERHVEILVADNGVGMSEEVRRRAFDPFFTTRRSEGGTGLGLHIIHNLVTQSLGGRLSLESAPDRGTSIYIILPLAAPQQQAAVAPLPVTDQADG